MKELVTIAVAFLIVVALAFYMYVGSQKHSISVMENKKLEETVIKNHDELRKEIDELKTHVHLTDSIYHNK